MPAKNVDSVKQALKLIVLPVSVGPTNCVVNEPLAAASSILAYTKYIF